MQRSRLRKTTDRGTDIGIDLPAGTILHHGDMVRGDGITIQILQKPEMVCTIRPASRPAPVDIWILAAHAIGNMHRPIAVSQDCITFPVQDSSEKETFIHMLKGMREGVFDVSIQEVVFEPHSVADVVGHG